MPQKSAAIRNTIDASYSGDNNYAASSGTTQTITVTLAPTTTTFTSSISSATAVAPGTSVTLTGIVLSAVTGVKTGTVNFVSNGTTLASAALNSSTGVATVTTTALPAGVYTITAVYGGDPGFAASTSAAIGVSIRTPQFDIGNAPTTLNVVAPGVVSTTFSIVPIRGYIGGVDIACSGLPANTQCTFLPATIAPNGGTAAQSVQLTIATYVAFHHRRCLDDAFRPLLLIGMWRKRKQLGRAGYALTLALVLAFGVSLLSLTDAVEPPA